MKIQKTTLRNELRLAIKNLPQAYFSLSGNKMSSILFDSEIYKNATTVMCFVSVKGEPDTMPILKGILADGKRLLLPIIRDNEMLAAQTKDFNFEIGKYNIPEPKGEVVDKKDIDLILLPCLSCNKSGERLGKGGGYYDRFLREYNGTTVILCTEKLIRDNIPTEEHDEKCEYVLTEEGLYKTKTAD